MVKELGTPTAAGSPGQTHTHAHVHHHLTSQHERRPSKPQLSPLAGTSSIGQHRSSVSAMQRAVFGAPSPVLGTSHAHRTVGAHVGVGVAGGESFTLGEQDDERDRERDRDRLPAFTNALPLPLPRPSAVLGLGDDGDLGAPDAADAVDAAPL